MNRTIAAITIASILLPVAAHSAFKLDSRYQDRDGDLVADIPEQTEKQTDPSTLEHVFEEFDTLVAFQGCLTEWHMHAHSREA